MPSRITSRHQIIAVREVRSSPIIRQVGPWLWNQAAAPQVIPRIPIAVRNGQGLYSNT